MRTAKASELVQKQFTKQSWMQFNQAKNEGHAVVVLMDFAGRGSIQGERKTPLTFRAAFTEDNCVTRGSSEAFASIGYLIVDMKV